MLAFTLFCFFMSSCNSDDLTINNKQDFFPSSSDVSYVTAKNEIKDVLLSVKQQAFDGESIDVEEFENIISKKTGWSKEYIYQLENISFTRSSVEDDNLISDAQKKVIKDLTTYFSEKKSICDDDLQYVSSLCSNLSEMEKQEIISGVIIAKMTIDAATEIENETATRGARTFAEKVLCNMSVSGIVGVWGIMGKGVLVAAGVATGGIGTAAVWVVTSAAGAALSAVAC